jgi:hypothetical protein
MDIFWIRICMSYVLAIIMVVLTVQRKRETNHTHGKQENTCVKN